MKKHSLLADLVDIQARLRLDQKINREQLKSRDREIGITLKNHKPSSLSILRYWISTFNCKQAHLTEGELAQKSISLTTAGLWLLGLVLGWIIGQTVLHYDGSQPVNIIGAILALVISQVVTLLLLILLTLGGLKKVLSSVSIINPATWLLSLLKKISQNNANALNHVFSVNTKLYQFTLAYLSQHFTVALNLGIIVALLYLVTTTDLAFGWNTTLDIDNKTMFTWFHQFSWPWNNLLPSASPSESLVDSSRYYRLQGQLRQDPIPATELGNWWLYILASIVIYGLIPRLITLIISGYLYDRAIVNAILTSPGIQQTLARMNNPLVTTLTDQTDTENRHNQPNIPLHKRQFSGDLNANIVNWAFAATIDKESTTKKLKEHGIIPNHFLTAGGQNTIEQDQTLSASIVKYTPTDIVIIVKAWEPPILDCVDFIESLRQQLNYECNIIVLLKPLPDTQVSLKQIETWESALIPLNDSALYIEAL